MKNKLFYIGLFILLGFSVISQDYGSAILLHSEETSDKYEKILLESFKTSFDKKQPSYTEFYTWTGKQNDNPIPYSAFGNTAPEPSPITKMVRLVHGLKVNEKPSESFAVDTTGKVTNMYLDLSITSKSNYWIMDLTNSEMIEFGVYKMDERKVDFRSKISNKQKLEIDMSKYFGKSDPKKFKKKNSREYNLKLKEIKKDYASTIHDFYTERAQSLGKNMSGIARSLKSQSDSRLWKKHGEIELNDKGKLKEFFIDATASENLSKGNLIKVYEKKTFGSMDGYQLVNRVEVKEVMEDKVQVGTIIFGRKKLKKAIEANADLVFTRNDKLIIQQNKKDKKERRVQIKGNIPVLSQLLLKIPSLKLIDRNYEKQAQYFTKQYTDEKFIDFDVADIQFKQEGIDFIFENTNAGIKATEVETGRIEMLDQEKKKGFIGGMIAAGTGAKLKNLCMEILDENIQIIEITDQKKGKIKKVNLYSSLGMELGTLLIYKLIDEKVGSRTLTREEEIGKAWGKKIHTNNIAEYKIKKGNKELFQALENNERIKFKIKY